MIGWEAAEEPPPQPSPASRGGGRRLALVTGGTRGIGRACAARLAGLGFDVIAAARAAPPEPLPGGVRFAALDVTDPEAVRALFAGLPQLGVLVCAAGTAGGDPAEDPGEAHWRGIMASNLDGAWRCCAAAAPILPDDGSGRVVLLASVLGLRAVPDQVAYTAAKHGVVGLARALALKLAPRRITVNALCPGWVGTAMAEARWRELGMTAGQAARGTPTGRITTAEEVAGAMAWLVGPEAGNVTGQALVLDGGATV
ncbi:MAG: SDR family oxidoreductase [Acetobacteraceae bacterium]|nr:SDR family oxidoreductase [Acetobacteraceae bacterium]